MKTLPLDRAAIIGAEAVRAVKQQFLPVLAVLHGNELGKRAPVRQSMVIGRDPDAALTLTDQGVSWHHARLEDRGDNWAVVDLGSTNGTFLNGEPCADGVLQPNDKIMLATTVLRFELPDGMDRAYDARLERLMNIDDLTGLFVRRKFDDELAALIARASQVGESVGLLVMDLDGVKQINDTHGHLFGAHVIGEAGRVIGRVVKERGFASRFGGDEYVAALRKTDLQGTLAVGEEILQAIREYPFTYDGVDLHPGISIGAAAHPESGTTPQSLFEIGDLALYRAKRDGKGCVRG